MNRFLILVLIVSMGYVGCKKSSGVASVNSIHTNNNQDSLVSMSATISGLSWQTDSVYAYKVQSSGNDSMLVNIMITATKKENPTASSIVFNITSYSGPDTYMVNPPINTATYYVGTSRHFANSGRIIVSTNTKASMIGSFSFTADTFVVSGKFNVANP